MAYKTQGEALLKELNDEAPASRKCLERIPDNLFDWKPHEKSFNMGYIALMVAEIPRWITTMIEDGEINFGTFKHEDAKTATDLVRQFDENMKHANEVMAKISDEELDKPFYLKSGDKILMTNKTGDMIESSINHLVHHRGQLTVYMRLNNITVPSIYGPSADDKTF